MYEKIVRRAQRLVPVCERISVEYGIPIVNKRVAVTPIALLLGCAPDADPVEYAKALDRAADAVGINFIGGYSALVHKGFAAGDVRLLQLHPAGAERNRKGLLQREHRHHEIGHQHGRRRHDGGDHPGRRPAHRRPQLHRRGEAGGVLQRAGGQPVYGGRVPRRRASRTW